MATCLECLGKAFAQVTRLMTSHGEAIAGAINFATSLGEVFVHWLQRCSTGATRFGVSACDALRHWLKMSADDVAVVAPMKTENLGTQLVPIELPKIFTKHDLVLFDKLDV